MGSCRLPMHERKEWVPCRLPEMWACEVAMFSSLGPYMAHRSWEVPA